VRGVVLLPFSNNIASGKFSPHLFALSISALTPRESWLEKKFAEGEYLCIYNLCEYWVEIA
jgi:hypothetical protein